MALQTSGPISLADIAGEFGGDAPYSLLDYYGVADGIPTSGSISFSDFYGKSSFNGSFKGKITVGEYVSTYIKYQGFADNNEGSLSDVVSNPPFAAVPDIYTIWEFGTGGPYQEIAVYTDTDLSSYLNSLRVFGNGKDITVNFTEQTYDENGKSRARRSNHPDELFLDSDVGQTFDFEVF